MRVLCTRVSPLNNSINIYKVAIGNQLTVPLIKWDLCLNINPPQNDNLSCFAIEASLTTGNKSLPNPVLKTFYIIKRFAQRWIYTGGNHIIIFLYYTLGYKCKFYVALVIEQFTCPNDSTIVILLAHILDKGVQPKRFTRVECTNYWQQPGVLSKFLMVRKK